MYTQRTFKMIKGDSDYCPSKQQVDKIVFVEKNAKL